MIPLLSGIIDTPKFPFFYQNDSSVVPGRDVSMKTNVLLHHGIISAKFMKLNHITSRQTHTNQHRSHLSHKTRKVSLACGFLAHFQKDNIHFMEKVSEILFYI